MNLDNKDFNIDIFTKNYHSQVKKLEDNLYLTFRTHCYHKDFSHIETFGNNWVLIYSDLKDQTGILKTPTKSISLTGKIAIYIPAFYIVEWQLPEGTYQWHCLSSSLTTNFPTDLLILKPTDFDSLNTTENILNFLMTAEIVNSYSELELKSKLAFEVKKLIEKDYKSELKLSRLSESMPYHRIYMSREFKKVFNISMVEYRHQLRIYEALKQMNLGHSLTDAIFMSGYSSINQFISYFKKYFLTTPSDYNFNKINRRQKRLQSLVYIDPN